MPALSRTTAVAAVALVAVVGAGGIMYLTSNNEGGSGSSATPPATTAVVAPTTLPTAASSFVAPGITGWKTYTSAVYDYTISYPDDWSMATPANRKWQPGASDQGVVDEFVNDEAIDGDGIAFFAIQFPGPADADLNSWDGLLAALTEMCAEPAEFFEVPCPRDHVMTQMCLGTGCLPVALAVAEDQPPRALFGDPETGLVTYVVMGRLDDFPAAARYGGTVMLLKSILSQLGVREPGPGEASN